MGTHHESTADPQVTADAQQGRRERSREASTRRYEPAVLYELAARLKRAGLELDRIRGPWRAVWRSLRRPGRNAEQAIPVVTNGKVDIAVDTGDHAVDLSGLLNSSGVGHLEPVPNLRPPEQDLLLA
jgi:hypothetical protein